MNGIDIKLTICIPTYNRKEQIQRQVRLLLPQLRDNVSLVVFDNCSETPISTLFTDDELKKFIVCRNVVNIGADANIARCLEYVKDGWAWPLGDDDPVKENAVDIILDTISQHSSCCYVNFGSKKEFESTNYEEALKYWGYIGTFGRSFFMSNCFFNMDLLKTSLYYYYVFLSSQVGQICMVIKYMEQNSNAHAYFTKQSLVTENAPGGWSPTNLITNSSIIIEKLGYDKKRLKKTLFKGLGDMYLTILSSPSVKFTQKMHFLRLLNYKLGFFNILRYNYLTLGGFLLEMIIPNRLFNMIRSKKAHKYNNQI